MVATAGLGERGPLVVAGSAYGSVGNANRVNQLVVAARMTNADRPGLAVWVAPSEVKVAAGIDGKIGERLKLARSEIDSQPLSNGTKIENQGAEQRDGLAIRVEMNVPIGDRAAGFERGSDGLTGAIFAVEAVRLHGVTDGRIECAFAFAGDRQRKMNCFIQNCADRDGDSDL
jgi:hypothetical protein